MNSKTVYAYALTDIPDPMAIFSALYRFPYTQFLDSTAPDQKGGRYSTIVFQPVEIIETWGEKTTVTNRDQQLSLRADITELLSRRLDVWSNGPVMRDPTIPPFQGGAVGYFGHGLNIVTQKITDIPQAAFGIYDQCVSFDHVEGLAWYIVVSDDADQAKRKYNHFMRLVERSYLPGEDARQPALSWAPMTLPAPMIENVRRLTDFINSGSFNRSFLCQFYESEIPAGYDVLSHYQEIRQHTETPRGACMTLGGLNVIVTEATPVFSILDRQIEVPHASHLTTRPEGTLRDDVAARELEKNEMAMAGHKKAAREQTARLSSICRANGILGPSTPEVESISNHYQIASITRGVLNDNIKIADLLSVFTPAREYCGEPVDRCLRVIADNEPWMRGPAFGHTAAISFNGSMTVSLNKDTVISNGSTLRYATGLPVFANTDPRLWYDEMVRKAEAGLARIGSDTAPRKALIA